MEILFGHEDGWKSSPRGRIKLDPRYWLTEKGTLRDFRKLLRLSAESDREHGTQTLAEWEDAVRERYEYAKSQELIELEGAERERTARLHAAAAWRDSHLCKEEERFRRAKVHRGKSHAERVEDIEETYRAMVERERAWYPKELERIRKRAAKARKQTAAWMAEIGRFREEVDAA